MYIFICIFIYCGRIDRREYLLGIVEGYVLPSTKSDKVLLSFYRWDEVTVAMTVAVVTMRRPWSRWGDRGHNYIQPLWWAYSKTQVKHVYIYEL
jgi:hypothetical protein